MGTLIRVSDDVRLFVDEDAKRVVVSMGDEIDHFRLRFYVRDVVEVYRGAQSLVFDFGGFTEVKVRFTGKWWPAHIQLFESLLRGMGVEVPPLGETAPGPAAEV